MHQLRITNGIVFLDEKEIRGVSRFKVKSSAEYGKTAELVLKMDVTLVKIEPELEK